MAWFGGGCSFFLGGWPILGGGGWFLPSENRAGGWFFGTKKKIGVFLLLKMSTNRKIWKKSITPPPFFWWYSQKNPVPPPPKSMFPPLSKKGPKQGVWIKLFGSLINDYHQGSPLKTVGGRNSRKGVGRRKIEKSWNNAHFFRIFF